MELVPHRVGMEIQVPSRENWLSEKGKTHYMLQLDFRDYANPHPPCMSS